MDDWAITIWIGTFVLNGCPFMVCGCVGHETHTEP